MRPATNCTGNSRLSTYLVAHARLFRRWAEFNRSAYYSNDRRFILGTITFYESAGVWALELAPYDTAGPDMLRTLYAAVAAASYFGPDLIFHPGSDSLDRVGRVVASELPVIRTEILFSGISYQPLNLAEAYGVLRFIRAQDLEAQPLSFRDIVVLDRVPNDISVAAGITEQFQTPCHTSMCCRRTEGRPTWA